MNLEIHKSGTTVSVYVDGLLVWQGSLTNWSKAIANPVVGQKRVA